MDTITDSFAAERRAQIYAAAAALAAQGQAPSNDAVHRQVGGGRKYVVEAMKDWRRAHRSPTNGPAPGRELNITMDIPSNTLPQNSAEVLEESPPPPLIPAARETLARARRQETEAARDLDFARAAPDRASYVRLCEAARRAREAAQTRLTQLEQGLAQRQHALPSLRVAARRAAGELAALEDEYARRLTVKRREAALAEEDLRQTVESIVTLAGPDAVPKEEGES